MSTLGAVRLACYQLLLLGVFGKHNNHGTRIISSRTERSHRHHLPTYMMHLYRNFKLNQTRPAEHLEHEQADTIKSILSKSKICFSIVLSCFYLFSQKFGNDSRAEVKVSEALFGPWLSNLSARHLQSTLSTRTNALRKADVD